MILAAQGAGRDSGIWITGSNLSAGDNAVLQAEGGILLEAAKNTFEQKTDSKSSSASIGIGYSMGGSQNGFTLELGASIGRGQENGPGLRVESLQDSRVVPSKNRQITNL